MAKEYRELAAFHNCTFSLNGEWQWHFGCGRYFGCQCGGEGGGLADGHGWKGAKMAHSHGSSIHFPKKKVCGLYSTLDFAKKNAWAKFIKDHVAGLGRYAWG